MPVERARPCRSIASGATLTCALLTALTSGCGYGFALEMTVHFDSSVDDTALARVTSLVFDSTGDETYSHEAVLGRAAKRTEQLLFYPTSNARSLTAAVTARDESEVAIAAGMSSPLLLQAGETRHVTITLSAVTPVVDLAFYVSPQGADTNAGTANAPFATLARAQEAMLGSTTKTTYIRSGVYRMTTTLTLTAADSGETWSYDPSDPYDDAILDGGATQPSSGIDLITIAGGSHITIDGLTLRNFQQWGIGIHGGAASPADGFTQSEPVSDTITIENCVIDTGYTTNNNGWAGGGVWAQGQVTNLTIANNVTTNQYGSGIRVHADFTSSGTLSGLVVKNNAVLTTDRMPGDNGAIYVEDPEFASTHVAITNNFVRDYQSEPAIRNAQQPSRDVAIYLDGLSNATISGNIIASTANPIVGSSNSTSTQAIFLGSGHDDMIVGNLVDLGTAALVLDLVYEYYKTTDPPMTGNVFSSNVFIGHWSGTQQGFSFGIGPFAYAQGGSNVSEPSITHNLYFNYGTGTLGTTGNGIGDAAPVMGVDPLLSGTTYTLAADSPAFAAPVSFPPIVGEWGPPGYVVPATGTPPSY